MSAMWTVNLIIWMCYSFCFQQVLQDVGEVKGDNPACLHTKSSSPDLKTMTPFALGLAEKVSMHHPDTQNKLWHLLLSVYCMPVTRLARVWAGLLDKARSLG